MERPILFSGEMVRAILDGHKTQTRRIIKGMISIDLQTGCSSPEYVVLPENHLSRYGYVGDLLWVRETWADTSFDWEYGTKQEAVYRATDIEYPGPWRPSIHMPRWASRLTLKITDLRVEKLQKISLEDIQAEGIYETGFMWVWDGINAKRGYPWSSNPWVWVIEFEHNAKSN